MISKIENMDLLEEYDAAQVLSSKRWLDGVYKYSPAFRKHIEVKHVPSEYHLHPLYGRFMDDAEDDHIDLMIRDRLGK